jgi:hypothetical protein
MNRNYCQAVVQVFSEESFLHVVTKISMCRGDHAHISSTGQVGADTLKFTIREDSQEFCLGTVWTPAEYPEKPGSG